MERRLSGKRYISYAEAREILHKRLQEAPTVDVIERTWEYLSDVGEGDAEKARIAREKLVRDLGLDEVVAAALVSICPGSPGEVRSILSMKESREVVYDEELVSKILEALREYCSSQ